MLNNDKLGECGCPFRLLSSPDGLRWTLRKTTGCSEDRASAFYNPFRKRWVFSSKYTSNPQLDFGDVFDRLLVQMLQLRRAVRIFLLRRTLPNHLIGIATTTRHLVRIFSQTPLSLQAIQAGQPVAMSMHGPMRTGSTVAGSASSKAGNISGLMARSTRSMALHTRA